MSTRTAGDGVPVSPRLLQNRMADTTNDTNDHPQTLRGENMNCETIDNLIARHLEVGDLLTVIGENTADSDLADVFGAIEDHRAKDYTSLVYEAIKAHMNRYLYLWGNAEKLKEIPKDTCAELLNEVESLRNLFLNRWLFGGVSTKDTDETGETDGEFKDMYAYELRELIAERMRYWLECNQTEWGTPGAYKKEFAVGDEIITLLRARRNAPEM